MAKPRRQLVLEAMRARLQAIEVANGFNTDAGLLVFLGEVPQLGTSDPDTAIALVPGEEIAAWNQGANLLIRLPLIVSAIAKADLAEPWLAVEAIIGDVKRAIELEDRTLGGLVQRMIERGSVLVWEREPGATSVAASVTYIAPYVEGWGTP